MVRRANPGMTEALPRENGQLIREDLMRVEFCWLNMGLLHVHSRL